MRSVSDRFQHDEAPTFYAKHPPADMNCPQLPMPGNNFWSSSCVEKTKKGGPCHTTNCRVGHELRIEKGHTPPGIVTCICGTEVGPAARSWKTHGYKEPTCRHCIQKHRAKKRYDDRKKDK